jgi:GR25 family glycosyltransferase involved in LPS biosynthesis
LHSRFFDTTQSYLAFDSGDSDSAIQRVYVISLDRKPDRWRQVSYELGRLCGRSGRPLSSISRRFAAVDARQLDGVPDDHLLQPYYSLADQMMVEPIPQLGTDPNARERRIRMTTQEMAVALSHIGVWKHLAASSVRYTLVLEDDIYFRRGFAHKIDEAWATLLERPSNCGPVDLLYLSFKEARVGPKPKPSSGPLQRPQKGLWQLSGYVLSNAGAQKLLRRLPAHGPIDLWLNLQFGDLDVFTTRSPIIEQRRDVPSTNSYSVLPVLSQVGVLTREKPLVVRERAMPGPVFALGQSGSGLTALATALSMLGFRCCSDISALPTREHASLWKKRRERAFNAYVNIGTLGANELVRLAELYPNARFIVTSHRETEPDATHLVLRHECATDAPWKVDPGLIHGSVGLLLSQARGRVLVLPAEHRDKWELLRTFLGCEYPVVHYPKRPELGQRRVNGPHEESEARRSDRRSLKSDSSPWIVPLRNWRGIGLADVDDTSVSRPSVDPGNWDGDGLVGDSWLLRDDTFPSNLALFRPRNFRSNGDGIAKLTLRQERTSVRALTSAAIVSRESFVYGRFSAELRPSNVPGLITGMFLHRNGPRQEIDVEFLGRDTTKILVNVYYNPGNEGTPLEYGYRGTPTLIDLGFDASEEFHRYEIDWRAGGIRWSVDGRLVHERVVWDPTPIPDLPMHFNMNLWPSRSSELAGRLEMGRLPATSDVRVVCVG